MTLNLSRMGYNGGQEERERARAYALCIIGYSGDQRERQHIQHHTQTQRRMQDRHTNTETSAQTD
jgi:hypothetical protein